MNFSFQNMNTFQLDVLKEVSNIGGGNAATALSKMLGTRVSMKVPIIKLLEFSEVGAILGDEEKLVTGVIVEVVGSVNGTLHLILDADDTKRLTQMLINREYKSLEDLDELALSAIRETGNILAGSYMSALAGLTGLDFKILFPSATIDMAAAILSIPAVFFAEIADKVLYIDSEFDEESGSLKAKMFLIFENSSFEILLKSLGVLG